MAAVKAILDEVFSAPHNNTNTRDSNSYNFGRIGLHNVVVACLPAGVTGKVSAASVAMDMMHSFPIKVGLMVGVGGGVWSEKDDVRLGDVVVSQPDGMHGGVVQWDFGKMEAEGRFRRTGTLNRPPTPLLSAVQSLRARHMLEDSQIETDLVEMWQRYPRTAKTFRYPGTMNDNLYEASYNHDQNDTCARCDASCLVERDTREETTPQVHYGNIASGDEVMKDGITRDRIAQEQGVMCFEMEAAGLMDQFPCVVIRGICDYADSHKNKQWQPYAAATAACYCKELLGVIEPHAFADLASASQPLVRCDWIPFSRNTKFVGRAKELSMLGRALFVEKSTQCIAVVGLGGVGKTQVALAFAYSVMDNHSDVSVFWIPATSTEAFTGGCRDVAQAIGIRVDGDADMSMKVDVKVAVRQYLNAKASGRWLLFVENADDPDILFGAEGGVGLLSYLPKSKTGLIVYTTRNSEIAHSLARNNTVKLSLMDLPEATEMLQSLLAPEGPKDNEGTMGDLLEELEYLPLAINQAAAYMNINDLSAFEYLSILRRSEEDLAFVMGREMRDSTRYEHSTNAIATTWLVSFKQILQRDPHAADLLQFISCIEWKAIPHSILPRIIPAAQMATAIGTLRSYSFITKRVHEYMHDMHRLVHMAAQIWVSRSERTAEVRERALQHLAAVYPDGAWEERKVWPSYYVHVSKIVNSDERSWYDEKALLFNKVGSCLLRDRREKEAMEWLEGARDCFTDHKDYSLLHLQTLWELTTIYVALMELKKAIEVLQPLIDNLTRQVGKDHMHTLFTQSALAEAYLYNGQVLEAQVLLEYAVATQERLPKEEHKNLKYSRYRLAKVYLEIGQPTKAAELLEPVIETMVRVLPEDDLELVVCREALATAYRQSGQTGKEVVLGKFLAESHKREHPGDVRGQRWQDDALAQAHIANGQAKKAIELVEQVVAE
ncbi:hypothetical protein LTS10_009455 [Elasticomyces elasticus]|nr:hypothetical protein LTS10_009455 [Elasticomyces elasticus]